MPEWTHNDPGWERGGRQCTGHSKQSGNRCQNRATPGTNVCRMHGSRTPVVQAAIARRKVEAEILDLAQQQELEPLTDPWTALATFGAIVIEIERILRDRLGSLQQLEHADLAGPLVAAYERSLDRGTDFLLKLGKLDLDEKRLQVTALQRRKLGETMRDILQDSTAWLYANLPANTHDTIKHYEQHILPALLRKHILGEETPNL